MAMPWTCWGGGESQLPQTAAAFNTPFFSRITIEKLIQTLAGIYLSSLAKTVEQTDE